jgi:hypothetical protein
VDEDIHAPGLFRRQVSANIEILHLARDLGPECGGIEARNPADTTLACGEISPSIGNGIADRRNYSKSGNYHTTSRHDELRSP